MGKFAKLPGFARWCPLAARITVRVPLFTLTNGTGGIPVQQNRTNSSAGPIGGQCGQPARAASAGPAVLR
jgi:hypothetical protein